MNKFARLLSMSALIVTTGFVATGCECTDQGTNADGNSVTTCESVKKFEGTTITESVDYTPGQALNFSGVNGNVRVDVGTSAQVVVEFTPYSVRGHSKSEEAKEDIENDVMTSLNADGAINVSTDRASGAFNGVGVDVRIYVPAGFDGAVNVQQNNGFVKLYLDEATPTSITVDNDGTGDIDITGARGALDISGDFDIEVTVASWGAAGENGSIRTDEGGLGNVILRLPAASAGSIRAVSNDEVVVGPSTLPEGWVEEGADNSKTFTFGATTGAEVNVTADETVTVEAF